MPFEFIDNNARIDSIARKRIRKLAATGKNAGKTVVRPSKIKAFKEQARHPTILTRLEERTSENPQKTVSEDPVLTVERQIGDVLCFLSSSTKLSPTSQVLAKRGPRHSPELNSIFQTDTSLGSTWVKLIFENEAFISSHTANRDDSREAIHHLCHTFRMVNEQLSENGVVSVSTIATVMMLAQYERHQSQHYEGLVHMNGLQRLINLRGGILEIKKDLPILTQKIFRIDLDYALYMGTTTMFRVEHLMSSDLFLTAVGANSSNFEGSDRPEYKELFGYLAPDLYELLIDTTTLSGRINYASTTKLTKLNPYAFNATIIFLGYRVLEISSLSMSCQLSQIENAVHLGIAMFVTTFMNKLDRRMPDMPFLAESLRSLVKCSFDNDKSVLLWILLLGEVSVLTYDDRDWLLPMVAQVAQELDLVTWGDVLTVLSKLPWIYALYNKPAQALWYDISFIYMQPDNYPTSIPTGK
ncbi:hypothetical protein UA08_03704 [Talaromyces atroroseus]|uniref:Uncharacterized protein n=1 Tax=Talaromyces atroroseus TaxID=1441469 RepID=A0A225AIU4_TALAT|nr:hypothetical protein UA08_03704 [Talaromyces atroroseus]OKL61371.1 hypothetical protein UA08_03704 [Talaromyces atroroseus]